jgi:glycerophosphoryl diester phosphodiesterase
LPQRKIEVVGHRGAAHVEPENTLRGFRYALGLGCDRIETDVRLSKDGVLVLVHDSTVDRTTNGRGEVAYLTLADLKRLDAGKGERIPTLQEAIDLFKDAWRLGSKTLLQIELKGEGTAGPVVEAVKANGIEDKVALTSFDAEHLGEAKRLLPNVIFGFLTSKLESDPFLIAKRMGVNALHLRHDLATSEHITRAHAEGLQLRLWNIDEVARMRWAIGLGVDGIGSNRPDLLIGVLNQRA